MKLLRYLSFCILILSVSCSQQKFAFRQTVRVQSTQQSNDVVERKQLVTQLKAPSINIPNGSKLSLPEKIVINQVKNDLHDLVLNKPITLLTDTLRKKYKFDTEASTPTEEKTGKNTTNNQYDSAAITGFVLSLLGIFYLITVIPGLIFSIKGLKSKKHYALAVIGLILSSIFILLLVFIFIALIIAIRNFR